MMNAPDSLVLLSGRSLCTLLLRVLQIYGRVSENVCEVLSIFFKIELLHRRRLGHYPTFHLRVPFNRRGRVHRGYVYWTHNTATARGSDMEDILRFFYYCRMYCDNCELHDRCVAPDAYEDYVLCEGALSTLPVSPDDPIVGDASKAIRCHVRI